MRAKIYDCILLRSVSGDRRPWNRGPRVGRQAAIIEVQGSISDQMMNFVVISGGGGDKSVYSIGSINIIKMNFTSISFVGITIYRVKLGDVV